MQRRDIAILLAALCVVVAIAVVVKPVLTGKSPDLSLPFLPRSSPAQEASPHTSPGQTPETTPSITIPPTVVPSHTWNGSPLELWYVEDGATVHPPGMDEIPESSRYPPAGASDTSPTPGILSASFSATPTEGSVPLPVQFTDTSTGIPDSWSWTFGDGATSAEKNPLYTYTRTGTYRVSLTVGNAFGANTRINQGYVNVAAAGRDDLALQAGRGAHIVRGGFIEFTVTKPASRIKIGGLVESLPVDSRVRLVVEDPGKGKVAMRQNSIQDYSFEEVILFIDGEYRHSGEVREINIQGYEYLISSLELRVAGGEGEINLLENGVPVDLHGGKDSLSLVSIRPDSTGVMILDCYWPDMTFFQGGVTRYHVLNENAMVNE